MTGIANNDTSSCNLKVRTYDSPMVVQTQSGVIIGGSKSQYQAFKRISGIDIPSFTVKPRDHATIITSKEGDWLSISDNVYSTSISGFTYNFSVYITVPKKIEGIDPIKLHTEWKKLSDVHYTPLRFDYIHQSDGLYIMFICLNIILVIAVTLLFWYVKTHKKHRPSYPHHTHQALGLR